MGRETPYFSEGNVMIKKFWKI